MDMMIVVIPIVLLVLLVLMILLAFGVGIPEWLQDHKKNKSEKLRKEYLAFMCLIRDIQEMDIFLSEHIALHVSYDLEFAYVPDRFDSAKSHKTKRRRNRQRYEHPTISKIRTTRIKNMEGAQ